jgi:hypothetical protein
LPLSFFIIRSGAGRNPENSSLQKNQICYDFAETIWKSEDRILIVAAAELHRYASINLVKHLNSNYECKRIFPNIKAIT